MVNGPLSHVSGPSSIPVLVVLCGLSFLWLSPCSEGFAPSVKTNTGTWTQAPTLLGVSITEMVVLFNYVTILSLETRNTTPAKPREGRFRYTWFVCDLKFEGWCSKSGPKSNTHCASYIVLELTADHTDKLKNSCQFSVNSKLKG